MTINNIEEIVKVDKDVVKNALQSFDPQILAKATLGMSPMAVTLLDIVFPELKNVRGTASAIRLDEIEEIHKKIVDKVNELLNKNR